MFERYRKLLEAVLDDAVTSSTSADTAGATNPPVDEEIEARGFPYADDPRYAGLEDEGGQEVDTQASTSEDAATSTDGQEPTEEEKALEAELARLATEKPDATLPNHLRNVAKGALRGKREAEAERDELRTELESARGETFRPTVPVEEFDAHKFTGEIFDKHPSYYPEIVTDIIKTHLDPDRMRQEPQYMAAVWPIIEEAFQAKLLPEFIQRSYGMDLATFAARVDQAFSATPATGQSPPANSSSQQIIDKYGLNTDEHGDLLAELQSKDQTAREVAQLRRVVTELQNAQGNGAKQTQEAATAERLQTFESMVSSDRQRLLDTALKALPRNGDGSVHKDFAYIVEDLSDAVDAALGRDTNYQAAKSHAAKWFKQPGNVESAKNLAGGDLKAIFKAHQKVITEKAQRLLAPHAELIRANGQIEQRQREQKPVRGGDSPPAHTAPPTRQTNGRRPLTLAERANQLYDGSRQ